ncbi:uncharacterized protein B4U80_00605, partial [Leptotrombidium deliense]
MAEAGFYLVGPADLVECVFCNGKLYNWKANNNPFIAHR